MALFKRKNPLGSLLLIVQLIFATFQTLAVSVTDDTLVVKKFEQWVVEYGRTYKDAAEKTRRFDIFKENLRIIEEINAKRDLTYKAGLNEYSDLSKEEFFHSSTGHVHVPPSKNMSISRRSYEYMIQVVPDTPATVDWVEKGALNPIRSQGSCGPFGNCWAFSAVASIEAALRIWTGKLFDLSEQELTDCARRGLTRGCEGGLASDAFKYIIDNNGISSEDSYPYTNIDDKICNKSKASKPVAQIKGMGHLPPGEEELQKAVIGQPIVANFVANDEFQHYKSGIFKPSDCTTGSHHSVVVVGYGIDNNNILYWLIRNSWGESWGERGYMRMFRGPGNEDGVCAIASDNWYPVV